MQVVVIGGGAAGFFGAIRCAEENPDAQVLILEKSRAPLAKVRISGGGRCNVTNACFEPRMLVKHYPRGEKELLGPFHHFQPRDTVQWFESRGVRLKTEPDNRMFPITDDSETIVQCLLETARTCGVAWRANAGVVGADVRRDVPTECFQLRLNTGESIVADRILLAAGGNPGGFAIAQQLGHTIVPPVPSLFTFEITDSRLEGLAGISVPNARVKLVGTSLEQTGPLLITHWGLSGPAVLKLSAWGARHLHDCGYQAQIQVRWTSDEKEDALRERLKNIRQVHARKKVSGMGLPELPQRLWERLVQFAQIDEGLRWGDVSNKQLQALFETLYHAELKVRGKGAFKEEFVTCGGVSLPEVNLKTMESRVCPGLFLAGEVLDIDGITGGFNFQSAWTTGYLAGTALAK